jgi:hypothetical protein
MGLPGKAAELGSTAPSLVFEVALLVAAAALFAVTLRALRH